MPCKLIKSLLLVLVLSAVAAPSASATFHSNVGATFLTMTQEEENVISTPKGNVRCNNIDGVGAMEETENIDITVKPTFKNCTAFNLPAHINNASCHYTFTTIAASGFHLVCPAGASIEIVVTNLGGGTKCTLTIGAQTPKTPTMKFVNKGASPTRHVLAEWKLEEIHYTVDGGGGFCGTEGKTNPDAKLNTGSVTIKGYKNFAHTEQADFWCE
jgi:hypothetical protein